MFQVHGGPDQVEHFQKCSGTFQKTPFHLGKYGLWNTGTLFRAIREGPAGGCALLLLIVIVIVILILPRRQTPDYSRSASALLQIGPDYSRSSRSKTGPIWTNLDLSAPIQTKIRFPLHLISFSPRNRRKPRQTAANRESNPAAIGCYREQKQCYRSRSTWQV